MTGYTPFVDDKVLNHTDGSNDLNALLAQLVPSFTEEGDDPRTSAVGLARYVTGDTVLQLRQSVGWLDAGGLPGIHRSSVSPFSFTTPLGSFQTYQTWSLEANAAYQVSGFLMVTVVSLASTGAVGFIPTGTATTAWAAYSVAGGGATVDFSGMKGDWDGGNGASAGNIQINSANGLQMPYIHGVVTTGAGTSTVNAAVSHGDGTGRTTNVAGSIHLERIA